MESDSRNLFSSVRRIISVLVGNEKSLKKIKRLFQLLVILFLSIVLLFAQLKELIMVLSSSRWFATGEKSLTQ